MSVERKPVAFGDLRGWINALKAAGDLQEIEAEVDWNIELGTVMRLAQGTGRGPALLFNNINDSLYNCFIIFITDNVKRAGQYAAGVAESHPNPPVPDVKPQTARHTYPESISGF